MGMLQILQHPLYIDFTQAFQALYGI